LDLRPAGKNPRKNKKKNKNSPQDMFLRQKSKNCPPLASNFF